MNEIFRFAVINVVTQIIINDTVCCCICREANQTLQESIEKRRTKLLINKPDFFSYIRKFNSVSNYRMSFKVIGGVAITILVVSALLIILADISFVISKYSKIKLKKNTLFINWIIVTHMYIFKIRKKKLLYMFVHVQTIFFFLFSTLHV